MTELACISPVSPCHLNYISRIGERDRARRISTISPLYLPCISRIGERDRARFSPASPLYLPTSPLYLPVSPVQASVTELAPGGVLFRQGDRSSAFYLVESGEIEMSLVPDDAEEGDAAIPVRR